MFDVWCFVKKISISFTFFFPESAFLQQIICALTFHAIPGLLKDYLYWLLAELEIACSLFRKKVHNYIKPEKLNSSEIEIMNNKNSNKNVCSLTHLVYWLWKLFLFRVIEDYSSILICLWNTRLKREMSKCDNKEQCLMSQNVI